MTNTERKDLPFLTVVLVYFGLVSLGFAQPLFNIVTVFRREFQITLGDVLLIIVVFQYAVTAALVAFRQAVQWPRLRAALDIIVFAGAMLSFIRQIQMNVLRTVGLGTEVKYVIAAGMIVAALLLVFVFRRFLIAAAKYAGWLSPIFGVSFVYAMTTHPLPLNGGGQSAVPSSAGPAVVLVVMDEFSLPLMLDENREINAERFPNFARLREYGVWYRNAITNYPTSGYSFPSFLTSRYEITEVAYSSDDIESLPPGNLFEVFASNGYAVNIYTDYFGCSGRNYHCRSYLGQDGLPLVLKTFNKFVEEFGPDFIVDSVFPHMHAWRLKNQHRVLLETIDSAVSGTFNLIHLQASHAPYVLRADGSYRHSTNLLMNPGADFDKTLPNYIAQLMYLDSVIGRALDAMAARTEPLVALFVSDHGNCWTPRCPGRIQPGRITRVLPELVDIPAFLVAPDLPPRLDDTDFQLIDILPTLKDAAGIETMTGDGPIDGVSRLTLPPPPRRRLFMLSPGAEPLDIALPSEAIDVR